MSTGQTTTGQTFTGQTFTGRIGAPRTGAGATSMRRRRSGRAVPSSAAAVVLVALVAVFGVAGCTGGVRINDDGDDGAAPRRSVAPSPTGLAASLSAFAVGSYRFKVVATEGSYAGGIDPIADVLDASVSVSSQGSTLKIDTVAVRGAAYTRLTGLPLPGFDGGTWYRIDSSRVTRPGALGLSATKDPTGVQALVAATHDVKRAGPHYTGTVDMTRVAAWGPVNIAQVVQLGEAAKAIPFEATVDERDHLLSLKVNIPNDTVEATYSAFGAPVTATEPPSPEPLPAHLYGLLGL